jgi:hypothetical protein
MEEEYFLHMEMEEHHQAEAGAGEDCMNKPDPFYIIKQNKYNRKNNM